MKRPRHSSSRVTITRYAPDGTITSVAKAPMSARPTAVVRPGPFAVWDDLTQSTLVIGLIADCVSALTDAPGSADLVYFADAIPRPLNSAERIVMRSLLAELAE